MPAAVLAAACVLLAGCASGGSRRAAHASGAATPPAGLSWPVPQPAPSTWRAAPIASGLATLFFPSSWSLLRGDPGTASAALRAGPRYDGYLNLTPRQGGERLAGWAAFRTRRNRSEGDALVHQLVAAEGLPFAAGARGSCVIDDYRSRVGHNPYRELACIVSGRRGTSVFVGAALQGDWPALAPLIRRAAGALIER